MDHGGAAARPTTGVESAELGIAAAVRGSEANIGSGAFDDQLGTAATLPASFSHFDLSVFAGRGEVPVVLVGPQFLLHHEPRPGGLAYPNDVGAASWRQLGPVHVLLVGPQLPGGVVPVQGNDGYYSALQPRPGPEARRGVVLGDLLPSGGGPAAYNWDYALQPRPDAGQGEVLVGQLPDGAGHGEAFVGLLPGGVDAGYDNYGYYAVLPRSGDRHGEVLVGQLPDGAGHGEAFVGLLPAGVDAAYDNYAYYALQPRLGAGHGDVHVYHLIPNGARHGEVFVGLLPGGVDAAYEDYIYYPLQPRRPAVRSDDVFIGPLVDGVGVVSGGLGDLAQETLPAPGTGRADADADGIAGALRHANLGAWYDNRGMVAENLRRLRPFVGTGACSVAINGLAAGPGSPAAAFHLFALLLVGLLLVILHVLRV